MIETRHPHLDDQLVCIDRKEYTCLAENSMICILFMNSTQRVPTEGNEKEKRGSKVEWEDAKCLGTHSI